MAVKRIEELTDDDVAKLTEEQMKELEEKGEIEIEDTSSDQTPPAGDEDVAPPPGDDKGETTPQTQDELAKIKQQLEIIQQENERLRRESEGRLRDLIELRQKARDLIELRQEARHTEKTEEKSTSPFSDVLRDIPDDDFIEVKRVKLLTQKIEEYLQNKEKAFNQAVEEKFQQIELQRIQSLFEESRKRAEKKYPDYQQRVESFLKELSPAEAYLIQQELLKSQDPAEEVYQMATRLQVLKQGEQIQNKKPTPKIMGGGGGGSSVAKLSPEKLLSMSDKEFAQLEQEHPELIREVLEKITQ